MIGIEKQFLFIFEWPLKTGFTVNPLFDQDPQCIIFHPASKYMLKNRNPASYLDKNWGGV